MWYHDKSCKAVYNVCKHYVHDSHDNRNFVTSLCWNYGDT